MNRLLRYRVALQSLLIKEVLRFARIWIQTIFPAVVTTTLYFTIFGTLIGERIGSMDGHAYIDYIVPGLILMAVITNSYSNVVSSFFSSKFQRHVEELLISPVPNWVILAGYVGGGVVRGLAVGAAVTTVSLVFTDLHFHSFTWTLLMVLLTSSVFSLGGFINAVYARTFDDVSIVPTFVLTPLTYLGGVFYSIHLLPAFWQQVSLFNPILYMINAFRFGLLGVSDIPPVTALGMVLALNGLLAWFSLRLLRLGIGLKP